VVSYEWQPDYTWLHHRAEGIDVMANYKALYQEVILDHNNKPRNYGALTHASHQAEGHNPLCGDRISVGLTLARECIDSVAFEGESCAICKASASMMTAAIKGKSPREAEMLIHDFLAMATGKCDLDSLNHIGRLAVFSGVRDSAVAHIAGGVQFGRQHIDRDQYSFNDSAYQQRMMLGHLFATENLIERINE
jgi:nitrogen fixation NifU-like protein